MKRVFLFALFCLAGLLASCGGKPVLYIYNWGDYVSPEVVRKFEKEFNCRVALDFFDSNESMYAKLKSGAASYDIVIPSDYMVAKMIAEDMLAPLNFANIPNFADIDPALLEAVDYVCFARRQEKNPHTPSSILRIRPDGQVEIIRK